LISVEVALDKILGNIQELESEVVPLLNSLGQVLAEDVYSGINVPPADNSALDGYALRSSDIENASPKNPVKLKVIDLIAAGKLPNKIINSGTAARIMTGAPMPEGADTVVGFEDTNEEELKLSVTGISDIISVYAKEEFGENVRKAGESIKNGDLILSKGTIIRPSEIGVLASMGLSSIKVTRRPVVAILATGDELITPGEPLKEGKIYNSNSFSIAAQITRDGGIPKLLGIALDNEASVVEKVNQALEADLLITIGGVSMGDYDVVKNVLSQQGEIVFWKVRTKPGKPLAFGTIKRKGTNKGLPHLGLAGNAVSCMVNYELFVRPTLLKMMGKTTMTKPTITAIMEDSVKNKDGRRVFARVIVENRSGLYYAKLTGPQGSGILTSMTQANGLAIVPEDTAKVNKGEKLQIMMLDWSQDL